MENKKIVTYINIVFSFCLLVIMLWLVWSDINPSGFRFVSHQPGHRSPLVDGPTPTDRVLGTFGTGTDEYWEVGIDPVYFDLYIPRLYQQITMTMEYKNTGQSLVEFGGLGSSEGWQITLKPAENRQLDELDWPCRQFDEVRACQNPQRQTRELTSYAALSALMADAGSGSIVTYHYDPPDSIPSVAMSSTTQLSDFSLLLTSYQPPKRQADGWLRASATFKADELWLAGHVYKFMVSAPGLSQQGNRLSIRRVTFSLTKEPITWQNLPLKLERWWERLRGRLTG